MAVLGGSRLTLTTPAYNEPPLTHRGGCGYLDNAIPTALQYIKGIKGLLCTARLVIHTRSYGYIYIYVII